MGHFWVRPVFMVDGGEEEDGDSEDNGQGSG